MHQGRKIRAARLSYDEESKAFPNRGGMCERLKQAVLKTCPPHPLLFGINHIARLESPCSGLIRQVDTELCNQVCNQFLSSFSPRENPSSGVRAAGESDLRIMGHPSDTENKENQRLRPGTRWTIPDRVQHLPDKAAESNSPPKHVQAHVAMCGNKSTACYGRKWSANGSPTTNNTNRLNIPSINPRRQKSLDGI